MFAIDGVKLPSNASKQRSGTRAEFARQADKLEKAAKAMLARHREEDEKAVEPTIRAKEVQRVERLQKDALQLKDWLTKNPEDRQGAKRGNRKPSVRKSNRTDNNSAKMATSKGVIQGREGVKFKGAQRICGPCSLRDQCLRHPERTAVRQVVFFKGKVKGAPEKYADKMKRKIDSPEGRVKSGRRFTTVEPVFGNLRYNKGLDRFTLRGKKKVDGQWKLFCLIHNIEKLAHQGYAQ